MSKKNTSASDRALAATVAQLDAQDQSAAPAASKKPVKDFMKQVAAVSDEAGKSMAKKIGGAFDERTKFEGIKNPNNTSIHKSLAKSRAALAMPSAAAIMIAANVEPNFINRSVAEGSCYNVYAADKLADFVRGLRDGMIRNAINNAVARSLFAFQKAGEDFTGELAKAAASAQYPVSEKKHKDLLTRHTVSPGTASTQTSSTMIALQSLGIVEQTGNAKFPVYKLTDAPVVNRLKEVLGL